MDDDGPMAEILDFAARRQADMPPTNGTNPYEFGETDVARRFAASAKGRLAYDHDDRRWFVWSGSIWLKDSVSSAMERVKTFVEAERERAIREPDEASMGKVKFVRAVEELTRSDPNVAVHSAMWDADPWLIGTPGGVVDLRSGVLRPGSPHDWISKQTLVAPAEPGTPAPLWDAFLHEATRGDAELQRFLQKWAGYCLTGDVSEEVLCFLYGDGGNGKGVFTGVLAAIMGAYAIAMPIEAFTAGGRQNQEYYRAQMAGARLVTASETESGRQWAEAQIKELTGNETPVSARQPHGRVYTYRPQCKLQFVGNHAPSLKGRSPAMERRLRIVPFEHKPATPNHDLKNQLVAEYPAILRWVLDGCLDWQEGRLGTASSIQAASSDYFVRQDVFGRWVEDRCNFDASLACAPGKLFNDYRAWCQANGETALNSAEFAEKIDRTKGCQRKKIQGNRLVWGIGLKPEEERRYAD
jgi:putative DNA primase/helicase